MAVPLEPIAPLSVTRSFRPYYSPIELDQLSRLQSTSNKQPDLSQHRLNHYRQLACGYIERVAQRIGFPRRTIATAQSLYHRFHLHFPLRDFAYQDVSLSAILVASKLEDTLKKLREIQIAGYQVANMMDGGSGQSEGDQSAQEAHRPHLIGIERLILQTICFNFSLHTSLTSSPTSHNSLSTLSTPDLISLSSSPTSKDLFSHLLRLSTLLPLPANQAKSFTYLAFLLATDLFRTLSPLSYPPHTCAAACLRLSCILFPSSEGEESIDPSQVGVEWSETCQTRDEDLDEIAQTLLDLLVSLCPSPPSALPNISQPSPSFSPSQPSPSESLPPPQASTSTTTTARQTERDRQLLQSGIPNAFSHEVFSGSSGEGGKGKGRMMSVDELRELKILIRSTGEARRRKRNLSEDQEMSDEGRESKRWKSLASQGGAEEVKRLQHEAEERENFKLEEREERDREKEGGVTEEEREREREVRREKRERAKPGSIRYRF